VSNPDVLNPEQELALSLTQVWLKRYPMDGRVRSCAWELMRAVGLDPEGTLAEQRAPRPLSIMMVPIDCRAGGWELSVDPEETERLAKYRYATAPSLLTPQVNVVSFECTSEELKSALVPAVCLLLGAKPAVVFSWRFEVRKYNGDLALTWSEIRDSDDIQWN